MGHPLSNTAQNPANCIVCGCATNQLATTEPCGNCGAPSPCTHLVLSGLAVSPWLRKTIGALFAFFVAMTTILLLALAVMGHVLAIFALIVIFVALVPLMLWNTLRDESQHEELMLVFSSNGVYVCRHGHTGRLMPWSLIYRIDVHQHRGDLHCLLLFCAPAAPAPPIIRLGALVVPIPWWYIYPSLALYFYVSNQSASQIQDCIEQMRQDSWYRT